MEQTLRVLKFQAFAELPGASDELKQAAEVYTAFVNLPRLDVELPDSITTKNLPDVFEQAARDAAAVDSENNARRVVSERLCSDLVRAGYGSIPGITDALQSEFTQVAAAYAENAAQLPSVPTSDAVLASGTTTAFEAAQQAAGRLAVIEQFLSDSYMLSGEDVPPSTLVRLTAPQTQAELRLLEAAKPSPRTDAAHRAVNPVLFAAVREGIELRFNGPEEAAELLAFLRAEGERAEAERAEAERSARAASNQAMLNRARSALTR